MSRYTLVICSLECAPSFSDSKEKESWLENLIDSPPDDPGGKLLRVILADIYSIDKISEEVNLGKEVYITNVCNGELSYSILTGETIDACYKAAFFDGWSCDDSISALFENKKESNT